VTLADRKSLIERARAVGLVARYDGHRLNFTPEKPIEPNASPYFSSGSRVECSAFLTGWHQRAYDVALRRLVEENQLCR